MNLSGMNVITNGDSYVVTEDRIVLNKLADTLAEIRDEYEERYHD